MSFPKSSEHLEQAALFKWIAVHQSIIPELQNAFSIPNEGKRSWIQAGMFKARGLKKGVPDVFLAWPKSPYSGLFVEMKHGRNTATPDQKDWIERLRRAGYRVEVCYGWERAVDAIKNYLGLALTVVCLAIYPALPRPAQPALVSKSCSYTPYTAVAESSRLQARPSFPHRSGSRPLES